MIDRTSARRRKLLPLLGLLPALTVGAYLYLRDARAAAPLPTPPPTSRASLIVATATATPLPPTATLTATPTTAATPLASPTRAPSATARPTASPTPTWVEVGRWNDNQIVFTAAFTVRGPWRIRWRLSASTELFQVMITEGIATPILLTAEAGATAGVFEEARGGTFSLMLHNSIPYEVIVEQLRTPP